MPHIYDPVALNYFVQVKSLFCSLLPKFLMHVCIPETTNETVYHVRGFYLFLVTALMIALVTEVLIVVECTHSVDLN